MAQTSSPGFDQEPENRNQEPVTCLGMTFENDEKRRGYFLEKLREKLNDPEFRKIEGFPIGEDEYIIAMSDPPYYTACPNTWIVNCVKEWEKNKPRIDANRHRLSFEKSKSAISLTRNLLAQCYVSYPQPSEGICRLH